MKVLITGICGFVGARIAQALRSATDGEIEIAGIDNLSRWGSERNRRALTDLGIRVLHGDLRMASDLEGLGPADWVIDAAANPSVLAGFDGRSSSRQVVEHNLAGTVNLLEYCRQNEAGLILLSSSRVYDTRALSALRLQRAESRFVPEREQDLPGFGPDGVTEAFSTRPPVSLYGATKAASELLALEYHHSLDVPVWINRCGVLAGAGQFGQPEQGIFAFWINSHLRRRPLRYIGFGGAGLQVRDCLHPADLAALILLQMDAGGGAGDDDGERVFNVSGGIENSMSLRELTAWCNDRFGAHEVGPDPRPRRFDVPWLVLDASRARARWSWRPCIGMPDILAEIATHAEREPDWLAVSGVMP